MRSITTVFLLLLCAVSAFAVEGNQVAFISGTTSTVKLNTVGTFETTSPTDLVFVSAQGNLSIPYEAINKFVSTQDLAHHIGVAPAIAEGLVRKRMKRHYFEITYQDGSGTVQVAVFEVAKGVPQRITPIVSARRPCAVSYGKCPSSVVKEVTPISSPARDAATPPKTPQSAS